MYDAETTTLTATSGALSGTSAPALHGGRRVFVLVDGRGPEEIILEGTAFNVTLTGLDQWSNGISVTLSPTFSGPSSSPNGTAPTYPASVTFTNGSATASVTLYDVQSTTLKVTSGAISVTSASFTIAAGGATSLTSTSGGGQSATVNTAFTNKLVATLADQWGKGTSGVSISFTVPTVPTQRNVRDVCDEHGDNLYTDHGRQRPGDVGDLHRRREQRRIQHHRFGHWCDLGHLRARANVANGTITFTSAARRPLPP